MVFSSFENSFISFFTNIPNEEAWHKDPSQIRDLILREAFSPPIHGINDAAFIPICLLKHGIKMIPQLGGVGADVKNMFHCLLLSFT